MAFELVPFSDIKALLGLDKDAISDYPALNIINLRLLSSFQEETGRIFEEDQYEEIIFTNNTPTVMVPLKALPISSVTSVEITSNIAGDTSLGSSDYEITEYGLKLLTKISNSKITVVYDGGLEEATSQISAAALYQLAYEFQSKEQIGATSFSSEGGTVNRPDLGLLKETKRMLNSSIHPLKV